MNLSIQTNPDGRNAVLTIKVVPGASRDEIVGLLGEALKVRTSAPPEGGKANSAVCALLAGHLRIPERDVRIVSGHTRALKRVEIRGLTPQQVRDRLPAG